MPEPSTPDYRTAIEFIGPGCWVWTVFASNGVWDGTASSREQAHENARAAIDRAIEETKQCH